MPTKKNFLIKRYIGLTESELPDYYKMFGKNSIGRSSRPMVLTVLIDIVKEPMFILLMLSCIAYILAGAVNEALVMLLAIIFVSAISVYQSFRSSNAIAALKQYIEPKVTVIRDGKEKKIASVDLVPGDIIVLLEGDLIPADVAILEQNDLTVNEAVLTGESFPVEKAVAEEKDVLYQGTMVNSGNCIARVTSTGKNTVLGKLGKAVDAYNIPPTQLQKQVSSFVTKLALFGLAAFLIILTINFINTKNVITSVLFALALAMAVIPEEIPVAFSSFMALGAYYLAKRGIIVRRPQIVENLGSLSVVCVDKTGTLTQNKMEVKSMYVFESDAEIILNSNADHPKNKLLEIAMLASEKQPFDAMEKAIWEAYRKHSESSRIENIPISYEYPLEGKPPMMTHVYTDGNGKFAAAKGAVERISRVSKLSEKDAAHVINKATYFAKKGYRVLGIASAQCDTDHLPKSQDNFNWTFIGMVCLYDPVKKQAREIVQQLYEADVDVKLLTGDYPETAISVANAVGIKNTSVYITGEQVEIMDDKSLQQTVKNHNVFVRMFPFAKLKVINALRQNGEIVGMTGDGVNDAPALKAAHVGIALGVDGTELSKHAADLILTDDDLGKITEAIKQGRRVLFNLKKAIRYIVAVHIPILLTASLPVVLGWKYANIFGPEHIIFFEIIMGPTCSVFYENEPVEASILQHSLRKKGLHLFPNIELAITILQGLIISTGVLILYYYFMQHATIQTTRTVVFVALLSCNLLLTFLSRSYTQTINLTIKYPNNLAPVVLFISLVFLFLVLFIPSVQTQFHLSNLTFATVSYRILRKYC